MKTKIIAIGDVHGIDNWKHIVNNVKFDKIIFVGDYFDSVHISTKKQIFNFQELVDFKLANPEKVILLIGNHDYHYLSSVNERYSGFNYFFKNDIKEVLETALKQDLLQMCYRYEDVLFTHAGITKTWLKDNCWNNKIPIEDFINDLFKLDPLAFSFKRVNNNSSYGDDIYQSPIWVRPNSLIKDKIKGFRQVVGHTKVKHIEYKDGVFFIDCLNHDYWWEYQEKSDDNTNDINYKKMQTTILCFKNRIKKIISRHSHNSICKTWRKTINELSSANNIETIYNIIKPFLNMTKAELYRSMIKVEKLKKTVENKQNK